MDPMIAHIREMDAQFQRLTGREAFGHVSQPTPTSWRFTFADGQVLTSPREARDYMSTLLYLAKNHPAGLPYPLGEPLPPQWDVRRNGGTE